MDSRKKNNGGHNFWKWAFVTLLILIVLAVGTAFELANAPANTPQQTNSLPTSDTSLEVTLNRKQVNALSRNYINRLLKDNKVKYQFFVGEKYATVTGSTKFLGSKIQFAINFIPKRLSNGNVLLKAKGLSIGRLNLPIKYVMGYIKKQYKLPSWVSVNQNKKTVLLDLNKFSKGQSVHYSAEKLDMQQGEFRFLITIPKNGGN